MEFLLVPACVQQNLENPHSYKEGTCKCQAEQTPTYEIDSLKKEINKKLLAKRLFS